MFENHRKSLILAGDQTVLPDRSILKERKLAEKAQLKGDIFGNSPTLCTLSDTHCVISVSKIPIQTLYFAVSHTSILFVA